MGLSYIFGAIGYVSAFIEFNKSDRKILDEIFENKNISVKVEGGTLRPVYINSERFEWGMRYLYNLPNGISSEEIKNLSKVISEGLRREISITFNEYTIIDVFDEVLPTEIELDENLITTHDYKVNLGINEQRENVVYDFNGKFSHLLIAGISGGGKSTVVHSILTQLSLKEKPPILYISDLKEGVELGIFEGMAHVKGFVTELKDLDTMLELVVFEMKQRYQIMKEKGLRKWKGEPVIVVMDELIDIKINNKGDTDGIKKLKQRIKYKFTQINSKGRAAKVYTLAATQRPDAEVIDGIIKTNISTTLAFKTRDATQSLIVMDSNKSANLPYIPGRGYLQQSDDMLIQTYYLSEEKESELLKDIPRCEHDSENRQMATNYNDVKQVELFDNQSDSNVIQFTK